MNIRRCASELRQKSKVCLLNFNLFQSVPPSTDEYQLRNELISTRLFIFLLTLSLSILLLYTSLVNITQTVNLKTPTITQYSQLYSTYGQTLTCACTQISINYKTFLDVQFTLHQVCSSIFVTQSWIDYLSTSGGPIGVYTQDFRATGSLTFQALNSFCQLVNQTISNRLIQFYSSQYVSASVIPSQIFKSQAESFISQFILSTTNDFFLTLTTIRDTTQSNALLSAPQSNYYILIKIDSSYAWEIPVQYEDCSCGSSPKCSQQFRIYDYPNVTILFYVPGIYYGCYIIESLFQSNFQCFYNQTCINELQSYMISYSPINVTALDTSLPSRFLQNSTMEQLLYELMVEEWKLSTMYENYYNECQPKECTYTYKAKNSAIYIITTIIGLIGGLITVLRLVVPGLVKFIVFCIRKWRSGVVRVMPIVKT